jgi:TetR/AcrR family transcriptional regulator, cholesterol catabolism regulator
VSAEAIDNEPVRLEHMTPAARDRRDRIVAAALHLLKDHEYESVQMKEVAAEAKVSTATIYRYFSSKEHLYAAVLLSWIVEFKSSVRRPKASGTDADRLRALLSRTIRAYERWPQLWRAEIALEGSVDPNARAVYAEFAALHQTVLAGFLTGFEPDDARSVVLVANAVLGTYLRKWATGRASIAEVRRNVDDAVRLLFEGPRPLTSVSGRPTRG